MRCCSACGFEMTSVLLMPGMFVKEVKRSRVVFFRSGAFAWLLGLHWKGPVEFVFMGQLLVQVLEPLLFRVTLTHTNDFSARVFVRSLNINMTVVWLLAVSTFCKRKLL